MNYTLETVRAAVSDIRRDRNNAVIQTENAGCRFVFSVGVILKDLWTLKEMQDDHFRRISDECFSIKSFDENDNKYQCSWHNSYLMIKYRETGSC